MNPGRHSHSRSLAITVSHSRRTDPPTKPARPQTQAFTNDRKSRAHDTRQGQQIESSSALTASFHAGSKLNHPSESPTPQSKCLIDWRWGPDATWTRSRQIA